MSTKLPGFYITGGKGFHVVFENRWTVSVQFGPGNYCDHYHADFNERIKCGERGSSTAETAVFTPDGAMVVMDGDNDSVQARQSPAQVLALLQWAAAQEASK